MQITIDTHNITDSDRALLASLLGTAPTPARSAKPAKSTMFPEPTEPERVAATAPVAKEAGDDPADAVTPAEPEPEAPTMADALAAATQAVSSGGSARVKAALVSVDSKRVSEMKVEDISAFLAALSAG